MSEVVNIRKKEHRFLWNIWAIKTWKNEETLFLRIGSQSKGERPKVLNSVPINLGLKPYHKNITQIKERQHFIAEIETNIK